MLVATQELAQEAATAHRACGAGGPPEEEKRSCGAGEPHAEGDETNTDGARTRQTPFS